MVAIMLFAGDVDDDDDADVDAFAGLSSKARPRPRSVFTCRDGFCLYFYFSSSFFLCCT